MTAPQPNRRPIIAVCGPGQADPPALNDAREVGERLALNGFSLINGGLGGVMEAAAEGFQTAAMQLTPDQRGIAIGLLPGSNAADANAYLDIVIPTGAGEARNFMIVNTADALIAIDGSTEPDLSYGTLTEVAYARRCGKFIVSLRSFTIDDHIRIASSALEAVSLVTEHISRVW